MAAKRAAHRYTLQLNVPDLGPPRCRGGPQPTEARVAAKRAELEAALREAGVRVAPDATTKLYQYYVRGPRAAPRALARCTANSAIAQ